MCMLQYHCAARKKHKGSRISAKAAIFKRGRKACKYSYLVEGGYVDECLPSTKTGA